MPTTTPSSAKVFGYLLKADLTTQWRNRRSFIIILLVPVIILFSWKGAIERFGAPFAIALCITVGLMAVGLMGYTNTIARDRDKGIFQRLRVAPLPVWAIMTSRLAVQLVMILLLTAIVYIAAYDMYHFTLPIPIYALSFAAAILGGAVYLSLGQIIVGLIKNPETVNSTTRLVYFAFIMVGMFAQFGALGKEAELITQWSPFGTVEEILHKSMQPSAWNQNTTLSLLLTIGYTVVFASIGIRKFQWSIGR